MASANVHYAQISDPQLLDIVDEDWMREKLPDDGRLVGGSGGGGGEKRAPSPTSRKHKKYNTAVPLPERVTPPSEETDDLQPDPQPPQKERWGDLGLGALH